MGEGEGLLCLVHVVYTVHPTDNVGIGALSDLALYPRLSPGSKVSGPKPQERATSTWEVERPSGIGQGVWHH